MASGNKEFGKRIKELRESAGFTQEQLAEQMGLDYQTISRLETGYYFTNFKNLDKFKDVLKCDLCDLFDFGHIKDPEVLKQEIIDDINKCSVAELRFIHKTIKSLKEFKHF